MNFKTLVFVALIATATIADDTFLVDTELERFLSDYTTTQVSSTACTSDATCSNIFTATGVTTGLTGCCAAWKRQTSSTASYSTLSSHCTPLIMVGTDKWFTYGGANYSAQACTTATNTVSIVGTACTTDNSVCNTTNNMTCTTFSWFNNTASSSWTASSGSLGSYCQKFNQTDLYSVEANSWLIQYKQISSSTNYLSGAINITSTSLAYTKSSTNFGSIVKVGLAVIASLMVFLY